MPELVWLSGVDSDGLWYLGINMISAVEFDEGEG